MGRTLSFITPPHGDSPIELGRSLRNALGPFINLPKLPHFAPLWTGQTFAPFNRPPGGDRLAREIDLLVAEIQGLSGDLQRALDSIEVATAFAGGAAEPFANALEGIRLELSRGFPEVTVELQQKIEWAMRPLLESGPDAMAPMFAVRIERRLYWVLQTFSAAPARPTPAALRAAEIYLKTVIAPLARKIARGVPLVTTALDVTSAAVKVAIAKDSTEAVDVMGSSLASGFAAAAGVGVAICWLPATAPVLAGIVLGGVGAALGSLGGKLVWQGYFKGIPDSVKRSWMLPSP